MRNPNSNFQIDQKTRKNLLNLANELSDDKELVAAVMYGSQIAGYAEKDSDYDLLVIINEYSPRIKYKYVSRGLDVSALIVDRKAFINDAEKASFGEFASGRLLNVFYSIYGSEFIKDVENILKRRVLLETLYEITSDLGEFSKEIIIPVEYFLFNKLKKRAAIYPPVLYSYSKTYNGKIGVKNTRLSCNGFLKAISEMEKDGLITYKNRTVQIKDISSKRWIASISKVAQFTRRGLTQYAVHGYAGRVGFNTIGKEIRSKISRTRKGYEVPEIIKNPRSLWKLQEGLLIIEGDKWLEVLQDHLRIKNYKGISKKGKGEIYAVSKIYSIKNGDKDIRFMVKRFSDIKAFKWVFLNMWALMSKRFDMSPLSRLYREYSSIMNLRQQGMNLPRIIAIVLDQRILITEYIDGLDISQILSDFPEGEVETMKIINMYGSELGKVHRAGYTLGDTKPSNAVYFNGEIYLVDLEQAAPNNEKGWDIAEFIYYSSKLTLDVNLAKQLVKEFLKGYLMFGEKSSIKESLKIKYLAPFQPILAINVVRAVRREMKDLI
jgi:tRNA A-37 threonylcarbamoyl transferase component Bud32/predicted nucleotidyltransferase